MAEQISSSQKAKFWSLEKVIHQGQRARQEDAIGDWLNEAEDVLFVVVADGAGGHGGGAEASAAAVEEARRCSERLRGSDDAEAFLEQWMLGAHEAVNRDASQGHSGARTAAVAMLARGSRVDWVHAGDCRLYHFRGAERLSRTRDDSVVQVLFEQGEITEAEMGKHEDQNRLLQAIGGDDPPRPRKGSAEVESGDVLLLCSDGFWENLDPEELAVLATKPRTQWRKELNRAVKKAVRHGGAKADNTSAVLACFGEGSGGAPRLRFPAWALGAVIAAILVILMALWKLFPPVQDWVARRGWAPPVAGETARDEPSAPNEEIPVVPPKP